MSASKLHPVSSYSGEIFCDARALQECVLQGCALRECVLEDYKLQDAAGSQPYNTFRVITGNRPSVLCCANSAVPYNVATDLQAPRCHKRFLLFHYPPLSSTAY